MWSLLLQMWIKLYHLSLSLNTLGTCGHIGCMRVCACPHLGMPARLILCWYIFAQIQRTRPYALVCGAGIHKNSVVAKCREVHVISKPGWRSPVCRGTCRHTAMYLALSLTTLEHRCTVTDFTSFVVVLSWNPGGRIELWVICRLCAHCLVKSWSHDVHQ